MALGTAGTDHPDHLGLAQFLLRDGLFLVHGGEDRTRLREFAICCSSSLCELMKT
jgi:hypothetical protein